MDTRVCDSRAVDNALTTRPVDRPSKRPAHLKCARGCYAPTARPLGEAITATVPVKGAKNSVNVR
jgi:hypothetical protein